MKSSVSHTAGVRRDQDTTKKARMPARLDARFQEYPSSGVGARSISLLTTCPNGMKTQVIRNNSRSATADASRKLGQCVTVPVAQISISCAAPRALERPCNIARPPQGFCTIISRPRRAIVALRQRTRDFANAHPKPKPRKQSRRARFFT